MLLKLLKCVAAVETKSILLAKVRSTNGFALDKIIHCNSSFQIVRCVSSGNKFTKSDIQDPVSNDGKEEFITIYSNPSVRYFAIINRGIWAPTVCAIGAYPATLLLFAAGVITLQTVTKTFILVTWCCLVIHSLAFNIWRKVGFIYVNKEKTKLKVGYITYWGKRDDIVLPVSDVMSFSDIPKTPFDYVYRKVKTFNSKLFQFYKLDLHGGSIVKTDEFEKIFGSTK